jgi:hypothetical protein
MARGGMIAAAFAVFRQSPTGWSSVPAKRGGHARAHIHEHEHILVAFTLRLGGAVQPERQEATIAHVPEVLRAWAWIVTDR